MLALFSYSSGRGGRPAAVVIVAVLVVDRPGRAGALSAAVVALRLASVVWFGRSQVVTAAALGAATRMVAATDAVVTPSRHEDASVSTVGIS